MTKKQITGLVGIVVGVACGIILGVDLIHHEYTWRLISIITAPVNICIGLKYYRSKS